MPSYEVTVKRKVMYKAVVYLDAENEEAAMDLVNSKINGCGSDEIQIHYEEISDVESVDDINEN